MFSLPSLNPSTGTWIESWQMQKVWLLRSGWPGFNPCTGTWIESWQMQKLCTIAISCARQQTLFWGSCKTDYTQYSVVCYLLINNCKQNHIHYSLLDSVSYIILVFHIFNEILDHIAKLWKLATMAGSAPKRSGEGSGEPTGFAPTSPRKPPADSRNLFFHFSQTRRKDQWSTCMFLILKDFGSPSWQSRLKRSMLRYNWKNLPFDLRQRQTAAEPDGREAGAGGESWQICPWGGEGGGG